MSQDSFGGVNISATNSAVGVGSQNSIANTNQSIPDIDLKQLITDLMRSAEEQGDSKDKQMVDSIEKNLKSKNVDTAKTVFDLLTKTVQMSAAGVAICKAFGWI